MCRIGAPVALSSAGGEAGCQGARLLQLEPARLQRRSLLCVFQCVSPDARRQLPLECVSLHNQTTVSVSVSPLLLSLCHLSCHGWPACRLSETLLMVALFVVSYVWH